MARSKSSDSSETPDKPKKPSRTAQIRQAYSMTRKSDPRVGWITLATFLAVLVVLLAIGLVLLAQVTVGTPEIEVVRDLVGGPPLVGICLGHQLLGQALGLDTFKLRFGHRGANHPVHELDTGRVLVTAQNHGFAVRAPAVGRDFETSFGPGRITHISLYYGTVEGLRLNDLRGRYRGLSLAGKRAALH